MNNFLLIIAAILVVVLTALFAVPPMINWNEFRGAFEEEASRLLDREVRVRGEVAVRILPVPYVSFEKVRIADAPGVPGSFARAEQFKMWLAVPPLLRGVFEARKIELEQPVIRLRTEPDGSGNWRKLQISKGNLAYIPKDVALSSVRITDGTLLFESHHGHEIAKLTKISGEMIASALTGPIKFIGTMPLGDDSGDALHEVRLSTARMEENGEVRFSGSVRSADNTIVHNVNGTLFDLLGTARAEGRLTSLGKPGRAAKARRLATAYEMTADLKLDAEALRLEKVAISFRNQDRQQTLNGAAVTRWREGVVTETRLAASWLDLDAIAGMAPGEGPLQVVERLLMGGVEPHGAGVTSVDLRIDQANLAGTSISGLMGRMVRRDGVTKIEALRASLPGRSALAIDGFLEHRKTGLHFDGNVLLQSASFAELAHWTLAGFRKETQRALKSQLATSFSLSGNIRARPQSIALSDAIVSLAEATAEGGVSYDWSGRPALVADIDAGTLTLEKFGPGLLAPPLVASFLGLPAEGDAAAAARAWQRDTDVTLRLRASRLSDGTRTYSDVDVDFARSGSGLNLNKFNLTWDPGLQLALSGKLVDLFKKARGKVSGTIAVSDETAGKNLVQLLSLAAGTAIPPEFVGGRTPMRLAVDAELGSSDATATGAVRQTRIVADGTLGFDRVRVEARTDGAPDRWMEQPGRVHARITGTDAVTTTGWLLGTPLGKQTEAIGATAPPARPASPMTIVMTASGTPAKTMKTFLRIAAGKFLDADFSGDLAFGGSGAIQATWSGNLDIRDTTAVTLARLTWPALRGHLADMPVTGRIAVARNGTNHTLRPQQLKIGKAVIGGELKLAASPGPNEGAEPPVLSGTLDVSEASLPAFASLLLRASGVPQPAKSDAGESVWPDTPFDFSHLAGLDTDVRVKVKSMALDAAGTMLQDAAFRLATSAAKISVDDFSARLGSASMSGATSFEKSQAGASVTAKFTGKGIALDRWAPALAQSKRLGGLADIDLTLSGQALSQRSLSTIIAGSGTVRLTDTVVPGMTTDIVTAVARQVIDGKIEIEALSEQLATLAQTGSVRLGSPVLKLRIANGTVAFPSIVFEQDKGGLRNATFIDLPRWQLDSQWTVTPAPQPRPDTPDQTVPLPPITLVYSGALANIDQIEPKIGLGDLERELIVRKMEANVARLERLRREDEARAAAEQERQRQIEEEQRRALEEEQRGRRPPQQLPKSGAAVVQPQPALAPRPSSATRQ